MRRSATRLLFLAAVFGPGMGHAQTSPPPDASITGEVLDDGFGAALAAAGDVNGDGALDYLASAPGDDDVAEGAGEVYLFYGPLAGTQAAAAADAKITGEAIVDGFGNAVSSAGDVNDDGFDDLLIGARSNDTAGIQSGRAYVFLGPLAGQLQALDADAIISGEDFDELGWSVAPAGDVDGDGFDDVLIGAWMAGGGFVGQANLFLGPVTGLLTVADADATVTGVIFDELLGYDVAAGDLNDDDRPDLILGAPRPPLNGEDPGRVYVFFGPVAGDLLASEADLILTGEQDNDELGISVAAGDVDGDGADDLIAGARQLFHFDETVPGRAYVVYGPASGVVAAADADAILIGEIFPVESGTFGETVASAGDVNGDGRDDVLVAAAFAEASGVRSGRAYLFHGPLAGTIQAADADRVITGSEFDLLGTAAVPAGDNDADGFADLLLGAPGFFGEAQEGYAALFSGAAIFADGFESGDTSAWAQVVD